MKERRGGEPGGSALDWPQLSTPSFGRLSLSQGPPGRWLPPPSRLTGILRSPLDSRNGTSAEVPTASQPLRQRRSRGCKEEFGHALVPLSLPRLRRLVPLSIGLSAPLLR